MSKAVVGCVLHCSPRKKLFCIRHYFMTLKDLTETASKNNFVARMFFPMSYVADMCMPVAHEPQCFKTSAALNTESTTRIFILYASFCNRSVSALNKKWRTNIHKPMSLKEWSMLTTAKRNYTKSMTAPMTAPLTNNLNETKGLFHCQDLRQGIFTLQNQPQPLMNYILKQR